MALALSQPGPGATQSVQVVYVDAPATAQSPYGQQARRYLQQRIPTGSVVTLEEKTRDRYGCTVAEVIRLLGMLGSCLSAILNS